MAMNKLQKRSAEKLALYKSLLKLGQSKKVAMKEVRKQFKSGLDSSACSGVARELGITNGQMKSRAVQYNLTLKTAKLVKAPKVTSGPVFNLAIDARLTETAALMLRLMKENGMAAGTLDVETRKMVLTPTGKPVVVELDK